LLQAAEFAEDLLPRLKIHTLPIFSALIISHHNVARNIGILLAEKAARITDHL
jgi:hypothetical protein